MALLHVLSEQCEIGFTGNINILEKLSGKYLGKVSLLEGELVYCSYRNTPGKPGLLHVLIDDMDKDELSFIPEPEIVSLSESIFRLTYKEFIKECEATYKDYIEAKKLTPPRHIRLVINPDIIAAGPEINSSEFQVLTVISDFNKVSDILNESPLLEYQTSNALVSLRKKKAIKVLG